MTLPLEAVLSEGLGGTSVAHLPQKAELAPGFQISRTGDSYLARAEVPAENPGEAKNAALNAFRPFLQILAAWNDPFEVRLSRVDAKSLGQLEAQTDAGFVGVSEVVFVGEQVGVVKRRNSLNLETRLFSGREQWPAFLVRGLDLNYAAVLSTERETKFLLWAVALDVLTWKKLGAPSPLLKARLGNEYPVFKRRSRRWLSSWGLGEAEVTRVTEHMLQTHDEGVAARIHKYLLSVGIGQFPEPVVRDWWSLRGSLAHGDVVEHDRLYNATGQLAPAVQSALRFELESAAPRDPADK